MSAGREGVKTQVTAAGEGEAIELGCCCVRVAAAAADAVREETALTCTVPQPAYATSAHGLQSCPKNLFKILLDADEKRVEKEETTARLEKTTVVFCRERERRVRETQLLHLLLSFIRVRPLVTQMKLNGYRSSSSY